MNAADADHQTPSQMADLLDRLGVRGPDATDEREAARRATVRRRRTGGPPGQLANLLLDLLAALPR